MVRLSINFRIAKVIIVSVWYFKPGQREVIRLPSCYLAGMKPAKVCNFADGRGTRKAGGCRDRCEERERKVQTTVHGTWMWRHFIASMRRNVLLGNKIWGWSETMEPRVAGEACGNLHWRECTLNCRRVGALVWMSEASLERAHLT